MQKPAVGGVAKIQSGISPKSTEGSRSSTRPERQPREEQSTHQARIGVMILNHNGAKWLCSIYESLRHDHYKDKRVYLVDNASEDESVSVTQREYPEVTVLRMPQNLGYCMAYNLAMPYAFADGCDWVIWANNDILLEPGCLTEMTRVAQSDLHIGVVGPAFLAWDKDEPNYYMIGNHKKIIPAMLTGSQVPFDVDWVEGSFLMVSRKCVEDVGPLDPYLYFYWEETDFCRRARYKGWRVVLAPRALARHYAGGWSQADSQNKATANRLQSRNYYIYQLANPFQGFWRNLVDAIHLFLVQVKASVPRQLSLAMFHVKVFAKVFGEIRTIYRKWRRDRAGGRPSVTTDEYLSVQVQVIRARTNLNIKSELPASISRDSRL